MRRDSSSRERLFFLLVLSGALLLLSALLLRHENAALPTRTFRDGFTVAEGAVRRTETVATNGNVTKVPISGENGAEPEESDVRTTTIKTEDGDEITIKRAATSKGNKITTISRDEKGKLTIEDTTMEDEQHKQTETGVKTDQVQEGEKLDTQLEDIPTGSPSAIHKLDTGTTARHNEEEEEADGKGNADEEAVVMSGGKKVTVVQVNRSLTKVSLADVEEVDDEKARR
ncbi:hypothetical protein P3T76_004601 [Phytophthora citrophthora]|uniref:Uncharacterized protein n=1 Tax=Phytophthora citrophthora TaxID=4793 RepID=A0AAD9LN58_9STRA|nr:hypothetical protein P3T76_004601 [Phytophthora citrophthora]